ncbi:hypothetical protein ASPWEDRAFT_649224 [Aspergillus wentii DTO 134E9]|uniref:Uncharacterized protein n=1 Tax=Aspergillus wentii DTO 134E9 TaxID=1073089 RepID=A0A1L9RB02_ASPWE|nr:uncharacterized protein ASPWEDRAFT_649224 [Aspergillus wentii DTO 134E9]OJJ32104.1 hypothetical protein ASPWEDRAFT_649224 [Aspergillus wentii DTO 134E9]
MSGQIGWSVWFIRRPSNRLGHVFVFIGRLLSNASFCFACFFLFGLRCTHSVLYSRLVCIASTVQNLHFIFDSM